MPIDHDAKPVHLYAQMTKDWNSRGRLEPLPLLFDYTLLSAI